MIRMRGEMGIMGMGVVGIVRRGEAGHDER
jgi:hypothetical protein